MATLGLHTQVSNPKIFGHRGCRGILPENSIIGFQKAINLGVDGIEFDVAVNKDKQIVISHAPFMEQKYCLLPYGRKIKRQKEFNLFQMTQGSPLSSCLSVYRAAASTHNQTKP